MQTRIRGRRWGRRLAGLPRERVLPGLLADLTRSRPGDLSTRPLFLLYFFIFSRAARVRMIHVANVVVALPLAGSLRPR